MQGRGKRGSIVMVGDGKVVVPVDLLCIDIKLLAQQRHERKHISLFDDTVAIRLFKAKNALVKGTAPLKFLQFKRLKLEKTIKLLKRSIFFVLRKPYAFSHNWPWS